MKKIGIIGGAGPLASLLLYESIVRECYLEEKKIPEILLLNFPFTRCLTGVEESKNLKIVLEEITYCIKTLERHGVDVGVLACNTLHLFLEMLPKPIFPFKALPKIVLSEARENKVKSLLLLGTQNSCKLKLYQDSSITIVYPSKEDQYIVDNIIDRVLEGVVCMEDSLLITQLIVKTSQEMTFEGVILGCTDLPVLHDRYPIKTTFPIYDSIKIISKKLRNLL